MSRDIDRLATRVDKRYVVGFMFSRNRDNVALVQKARPAWQAGLLNGIGGHIEPNGETPLQAMVREFKEETGYQTELSEWIEYVILTNSEAKYELHIFKMISERHNMPWLENLDKEEPVCWYLVNRLPENVIPNLRWLIPLALDETVIVPITVFDKGN